MSTAPVLHWLPESGDWRARMHALSGEKDPVWSNVADLARNRLDFLRTNMVDSLLRRAFDKPPDDATGKPVRLAVLGSSTLAHLQAGLRVAALRRDIHLATYEGEYGQYRQDLANPRGDLRAFSPDAVLFSFDARHVTAGLHAGFGVEDADEALDRITGEIAACWRLAREAFGCPVLQQTIVPCFVPLLGNSEHRLPGSRVNFVRRLNEVLRKLADDAGVFLVALDERIATDGLGAWHDVALWHRSKQEISPAAAPMYGELVARILAAIQGRASKCLVLDLDNTLWGGVVGDDGVDGLVLGQGSGTGEAFLAIQQYAKELSRRGVILAVCSKNDEAHALEAFECHPEMALRRSDIACFVANWSDKATNLRSIASALNIGLDALVLLDDNPAERGLVRSALPMVAVPELADDPALYPKAVADAGYFESIGITGEDRGRSEQYQTNRLREDAKAGVTDLPAFLRGLEMKLVWRVFDRSGLSRITQLINKTNQFNLTTRRRTEDEVLTLMMDPAFTTLQLRLLDRFGDNGMIAVVIGRLEGDVFDIDTWLMSCRVLGREVETATLNILAAQAVAKGARRLRGTYVPTAKNGMVRDHYRKLGFIEESTNVSMQSTNSLELNDEIHRETPITIVEG